MTINQAIQTVRPALGDRYEHHPECDSQRDDDDLPCDCYAQTKQSPHKAMDIIEEALKAKETTHA